jgi:EAL domain-containing protein (putative c-di-GMP-specific phosphodiesterase class I)
VDDPPVTVDGLETYLQPIIEVATGAVWGFEALARFGGVPVLPADEAIESAHRAGYGHDVEAACLRAALDRRPSLPAGARLALNVSPDGLLSHAVVDIWDADLHGVVVEVTEHDLAGEPASLVAELARLRERGAEIAVDDVGTGYAGLLRLAVLRPDVVKLDRTIVSGVRDNDAQRAVLETFVGFAHRLRAKVVGEGVESLDDLFTLVEFDVDYGQGWAIARPAPDVEPVRDEVVETCLRARAGALQRAGPGAQTAERAHAMHAVVGTLAGATGLAGLHLAAAQAAEQLGVDVISASVLGGDGALREFTSSGEAIDTDTYPLADYPATRDVVQHGVVMEAHANDAACDPAERALLARHGHSSLLMVPLTVGAQRIGVLEFLQRTHRRWTATDIADARGLADHLGSALLRVTS